MTDIHPTLLADCYRIGCLGLSHLLLMNDANFPWLILVPDRNGISEIWQLSAQDQAHLAEQSSALLEQMSRQLGAHKMNMAALGNVVPQLHIHHIARFKTDPSWPKPVWGVLPPRAYTDEERLALIERLDLTALDGFEPL